MLICAFLADPTYLDKTLLLFLLLLCASVSFINVEIDVSICLMLHEEYFLMESR